jgi:hypothetical protein
LFRLFIRHSIGVLEKKTGPSQDNIKIWIQNEFVSFTSKHGGNCANLSSGTRTRESKETALNLNKERKDIFISQNLLKGAVTQGISF